MPHISKTSCAALLALTSSAAAGASTLVRFETNLGDIDVRLYDTATPNSVANFLNYVTTDRYDDTFFHRVPQSPAGGSADFVVQGGGFQLNDSIFDAQGIETDAPIGAEPGLTNTRGVVDTINNLPTINAAVAANAPGEDFDEILVLDLDVVIAQQDVTNTDAVILNTVSVLTFDAGDYDFNGVVNQDDFLVWQNQFASSLLITDQVGVTPTTFAEADGNGDGVVNADDLAIWRAASDTLVGDYNGDGFVGQEDLDLVLLNFGDALLPDTFEESGLATGFFDGLIGQDELDAVLLNFGSTNSAAAVTAVPEPTTAGLLGLAGAGLLLRRRRHA